ncbi:KH domain-containing protein HEN4-like [Cucurbita maxima]|uniref:KH domain-containing protein HEN4-like n=1 Tax=Cucurbita maxima TaxID=3661 RepID=A0A6J1IFP2_CUCMA|nr:KH domain-containing protein HEN4-like [Cucurbita maxima]XP_022975990.1 KH domain-containing protein HEN4-like [Cucurbita maxima]XP_022975991.1 KH domain-containing protein HEN4-like [Cucurbita maxima]
MSAPLTPSKRSRDRNIVKSNGKGKWQKTSGSRSHKQSFKLSPGYAVFRVLFPVSRIDSLAGGDGDGDVLSKISEETGVEIRVEDTIPGCDERIVVIGGSNQETEVNPEEKRKEDNKNSEVEENEGDNAEWTKKEDKVSLPGEESKQKEVPYLQLRKALFLVSEKIFDEEPEADGADVEGDKLSTFVLRLLVFSSQVGCLLGKGGSVIKQMSSDSGAQIRILPRDKLPPCATSSDELVQISGGNDVVKRALELVFQQLIENSPHDKDPVASSMTAQSSHSSGQSRSWAHDYLLGSSSFNAHAGPYSVPREVGNFHSSTPSLAPNKQYETSIPGRIKPSQEILSFRLLCPSERVGNVIGKGGVVVKALQQETGCDIKVIESALDPDDRIILVTGPANPDDRISPVQDAVFRVQARIVKAVPDSKEQNMVARFLVYSNQIGCLLGKGGSIIAEMRKSTGAYIRILGKEQVPKCVGEDEEMVQINGDPETVQDAMLQITTRLRQHFFRDAFPSVNNHPNPAFVDRLPSFPSYFGRRELSPPGIYSNLGPSFHKFDALSGIPSLSDLRDDRPAFLHRPGAPLLSDRKPWSSQGLVEGGVGLPDFTGAHHRRIAGFGGGNNPAIITSTTVEVAVPRDLVPVICGENGECLKQIRQISDAKITITEPKQGAVETVIIISGTPEQTHAAQSLIQAFVISETESS